jgi:pyruvate,water dikinase
MTAGGLVMEKGGAMSHGAVVAREFGIPAVVGVTDAMTRIVNGQTIEVDGITGRVFLDTPADLPADPIGLGDAGVPEGALLQRRP